MTKRKIIIKESDLVKTIAGTLFSGLKTTEPSIDDKTNRTDSDIEGESDVTSSPKISGVNKSSSFNQMAELVVDNIEGGYYHPVGHRNVRGVSRMGKSGETMFGLDRKYGPKLPNFWSKVDELNPSKTLWKYNETLEDKPEVSNQLKGMLYPEMERLYNDYFNRYLSKESQSIVKQNPPLMFHFVYATWNGPKYFKDWGSEFNQEVKKGNVDPKKLEEFAVNQRLRSNKMIASTASKVDQIMGTLA